MQAVKNICDELQRTSGKKDKEAILLREKDNECFKYILDFLLNPFITTGISTQKINKKIQTSIEVVPENIFEYLKENKTGRDVDIVSAQRVIDNLPEELKGFYKSIITKTLKLGIDAKTVNKVYGEGFIPTFDVMLGTSIEHCKISEGTWFSISHKLNGNRCVWYKGKLYTRQGKEYTGLDHIINNIKYIFGDEDVVLDGELVYKNNEMLSDSEAFRKGTGIAQSKDKDKSDLRFIIFDIITAEDFERGSSKLTYKERVEKLWWLRGVLGDPDVPKNISVVDIFYQGTDQSEIWKWLHYAEENDLEGVVLNLDAPYQCKRTKDLIKVKEFYNVDLEIVGYEEGSGKLTGTLGALIVDFKGNKVNVGSGLDDATRAELWNDRDSLIGKIVEVKYKEISMDKKTGKESLQFPIFVSMRDDKDEVSYE